MNLLFQLSKEAKVDALRCTRSWKVTALRAGFEGRTGVPVPPGPAPPAGRASRPQAACRCAEPARGVSPYLRAHLPSQAAAAGSRAAPGAAPGAARGSRVSDASRRRGCRRGMGAAGLLWVSLALLTPGVLGEPGGGARREGRDCLGPGGSLRRHAKQSPRREGGGSARRLPASRSLGGGTPGIPRS